MLAQARLLFVLGSLRWGLIPTSEKQLVFSFQSTVATQLRFSGGNFLTKQPATQRGQEHSEASGLVCCSVNARGSCPAS